MSPDPLSAFAIKGALEDSGRPPIADHPQPPELLGQELANTLAPTPAQRIRARSPAGLGAASRSVVRQARQGTGQTERHWYLPQGRRVIDAQRIAHKTDDGRARRIGVGMLRGKVVRKGR